MKRPSFQFYPADWRNNGNLRRCTWEARGVWVEVMGLLHDSDEYGLLRWPLKEIAQALGAPMRAVQELVSKGVFKGADRGQCEAFVYTPRSGRKDGSPVLLVAAQEGPVWYSSRMVRDEYVRTIRGQETRFGDDPKPAPKTPPKAAPNPPFGEGQGDGSTSSSTSTTSSLRSEVGKPPRKRDDSPPVERPQEVDEQTWADWLKLRKAKKAPVTITVLDGARTEAAKAGMPLVEFFKVWCSRGSQGLEASWLKPAETGRAANPMPGKFEGAARAIYGTPKTEKDYVDV